MSETRRQAKQSRHVCVSLLRLLTEAPPTHLETIGDHVAKPGGVSPSDQVHLDKRERNNRPLTQNKTTEPGSARRVGALERFICSENTTDAANKTTSRDMFTKR